MEDMHTFSVGFKISFIMVTIVILQWNNAFAECESSIIPDLLSTSEYSGCKVTVNKIVKEFLPKELSKDQCLTYCTWYSLSSIKDHPLKKLQDESKKSKSSPEEGPYFIKLKMKPVAGAKVVAINLKLAKKIGLISEKDLKDSAKLLELEKRILNDFSYVVSEDNPQVKGQIHSASSLPVDKERKNKNGLATYYLGISKHEGEPRGDGRCVTMGRAFLSTKEGKKIEVDVTLKGVCPTSLQGTAGAGWAGHTDGLQDIDEGVQSMTRAHALRNSSQDLALIRLPITYGREEKIASLTVRILPSVRLGALHWHSGEESFQPFFEYALMRELGISDKEKLNSDNVINVLRHSSKNLGKLAAQYRDENIFHSSPTIDNMLISGISTDTGALKPMAFQNDAKYGISKFGEIEDAHEQYASQFYKYVVEYLKGKGVDSDDSKLPKEADVTKWFGESYALEIGTRRLTRLGFSSDEQKQIDARCPSVAQGLFQEIDKMNLDAYAFDLKLIFSHAMSGLKAGEIGQKRIFQMAFFGHENQALALGRATELFEQGEAHIGAAFFSKLKTLISCVNQGQELTQEQQDLAHENRIKRATSIALGRATHPDHYKDAFYNFYTRLKTTTEPGFSHYSELEKLSRLIVDHPSSSCALVSSTLPSVDHLKDFLKNFIRFEDLTESMLEGIIKWKIAEEKGIIDPEYIPEAKKMIEHLNQTDTPNSGGLFLLHLAAKGGHEGLVKDLLKRKVNVNQKDLKTNRTPLYFSAENGHKGIVRLLMEHGASFGDVNAEFADGKTPMDLGLAGGDEDFVGALLELGADVNKKGYSGRTPLYLAIEKGHEKIVKLLLEHKASASERDIMDSTLLHKAALEGNVEIIKLLLEHGASLEETDLLGDTPLEIAKSWSQDKAVKFLEEYQKKIKQ